MQRNHVLFLCHRTNIRRRPQQFIALHFKRHSGLHPKLAERVGLERSGRFHVPKGMSLLLKLANNLISIALHSCYGLRQKVPVDGKWKLFHTSSILTRPFCSRCIIKLPAEIVNGSIIAGAVMRCSVKEANVIVKKAMSRKSRTMGRSLILLR